MTTDTSTDNEQITLRREKLQALRGWGIAYPADFRRDALAAGLHARYGELDAEALEAEPHRVKIAGRMMTRRVMGKAAFAHVQDMSGRIQVYVQREAVSEAGYEEFKKWDIGDILGVEGVVFRTRAGELSIRVEAIRLLAKALRPLPEKYHGIVDTEIRYRQRYLDLIMNEEVRETFRRRSRIVEFVRRFLVERDFLEVETPMMQAIPGGAAARPFVTHHNALDIPLYLRIAPELYLKRLVVGGFERVFEINRNFRNEGVSARHNPEFTMLEFYQAYADHHELMDLTEEMLRGLAREFSADGVIEYQGLRLDFGHPFRRLSVRDAIVEYNPGFDPAALEDKDRLAGALRELRIPVKEGWGLGKLQLELFEATVEEQLTDPTFIVDYPTEVSPLARRNDADPDITDRFELFIAGREIANGFTELNDPEDQADRFRDQLQARDAGDDEAMLFDADYIRALEYGMPPTAGEGIGIDRLVMLFTDSASIRDVLLFPLMKPE